MLQDESWQQNVSMDLYAATAHIQYLTNVVHRLCTQLADRGIVTPLGASEEFRPYEAPEREMPWLSKDAGPPILGKMSIFLQSGILKRLMAISH
jgi:hypothetical protein